METDEKQNHTVKGILKLYMANLTPKVLDVILIPNIICAAPDNWLQVVECTQKIGMNKLTNIWLHRKTKNTATDQEVLSPNW